MKKYLITILLIIGIVNFYNEDKKYGYMTADSGEIYYEYDADLIDEIVKGDKVQFESKDTRKGLKAVNVRLCKNDK